MPENPTPSHADLLGYIAHGIASAPQSVGVIRMRDATIETRRKSRKHGPEAVLSVSDDVIKALRGEPADGPEVLLVVVSRETCDARDDRERRKESGIVIPGEV